MKKLLVALGFTAVAIGGLAACDPAKRCGGVLTEDTVLTKDLLACAGDGLVVGADGIVVDLNGHIVQSAGGVGLRVDGHDGVRIRNGTVEGVEAGLAATDADELVVEDVVARGDVYDQGVGVDLERVTDGTIRRVTAHALDGFVLTDSHRNRLESSRAPGGADTGNGLTLRGSDSNRILVSSFTGGGDDGVSIVDSHANELVDVNASGSNTVGIHIRSSDGNRVRRATAGSEFGAVEVIDSTGTVVQDTARRQSVSEMERILVRGSTGTLLVRNDVGSVEVDGSSGTTVRDGWTDRITVSSSDRTDLDGNVVAPGPSSWADPEYGIHVSADSTGTVVRGNVVTGFLVDGIAVAAPGTQIRNNTADDNGDHGIHAVAGVVDGGGNHASGNGNPVQCVNVVCT